MTTCLALAVLQGNETESFSSYCVHRMFDGSRMDMFVGLSVMFVTLSTDRLITSHQ